MTCLWEGRRKKKLGPQDSGDKHEAVKMSFVPSSELSVKKNKNSNDPCYRAEEEVVPGKKEKPRQDMHRS